MPEKEAEEEIFATAEWVNDKSPTALLDNADIRVWIDKKVTIAHNKIIIADNHRIISGSFNFSANAQNRNAENVVFIESPKLAQAYTQNWDKRQKASLTLEVYITSKEASDASLLSETTISINSKYRL